MYHETIKRFNTLHFAIDLDLKQHLGRDEDRLVRFIAWMGIIIFEYQCCTNN